MSTGILLSYKGLGANILHLSYCHEIAKAHGPVKIITLSNNYKDVVEDDPLIDEVIYLDKYYKKISDIIKLSKNFKVYNFNNFFIFYPSIRFFLAAKLAGIKNIYTYPLFKKKNLHLVKAAKKFIEKNLRINSCPTESSLFISDNNKKIFHNYHVKNKKNIIIGIGSSGPTTKWGHENYIKLMEKLKEKHACYFFLLGGLDEKGPIDEIIKTVGQENSKSLAEKSIKEIIPIILGSDMYVGNDSFGQHVACQSGKPSIILLLDTPGAYSEYSVNQHQILPEGVSIKDITHDSACDPNKIKVDVVLNKVLSLL